MSDMGMGGYTAPTEQIYGNLSYEQIIARAVDRCLHYRVIDPTNMYIQAVQQLRLSLVDIPGKPIRTDADAMYDIKIKLDKMMVEKMDIVFSEITRILSNNKMLFRSVMIETGREQV